MAAASAAAAAALVAAAAGVAAAGVRLERPDAVIRRRYAAVSAARAGPWLPTPRAPSCSTPFSPCCAASLGLHSAYAPPVRVAKRRPGRGYRLLGLWASHGALMQPAHGRWCSVVVLLSSVRAFTCLHLLSKPFTLLPCLDCFRDHDLFILTDLFTSLYYRAPTFPPPSGPGQRHSAPPPLDPAARRRECASSGSGRPFSPHPVGAGALLCRARPWIRGPAGA
jgi:hypothetical protein